MKQVATKHYCVAGFSFTLCAQEEQLNQLANLQPFETEAILSEELFKLCVVWDPLSSLEGWKEFYIDRSDEDMPRIEMYQKDGEWLLCVSQYRESEIVCALKCAADWKEAVLFIDGDCARFAIDNALMLLYAFTSLSRKTLLFHSSVTVRDGVGYMFLGHSGTGKSTHSRMWLQAFPEAWLLNDDNPVVRLMEDGTVRVYGSPWSGKTPCYKQEDVPVGALVQLSQAPHNAIQRLRMSQAYPHILSSVSGLKLVPEMMDALYETIAQLLATTPVYLLECLPNEEAAQLCAQTCLSSLCRTDQKP